MPPAAAALQPDGAVQGNVTAERLRAGGVAERRERRQKAKRRLQAGGIVGAVVDDDVAPDDRVRARAGEVHRCEVVDQMVVVLWCPEHDRTLTGQRLAGVEVELSLADYERATKCVGRKSGRRLELELFVMVPVSPERSPLRVRVALVLISPALPVIALFTMVLVAELSRRRRRRG